MDKRFLNKIGLTFEYSPYTIEKGKIKEFVLAIGDDNPIYYDREKAISYGYRDIPIPPTFVTVVDFWNDMDFYQMLSKLELDIPKILHGEQEYHYLGEICAGDVITGQATIVSAIQKNEMNFITIETEFVNQYKEPVLKGRSTLIERQ